MYSQLRLLRVRVGHDNASAHESNTLPMFLTCTIRILRHCSDDATSDGLFELLPNTVEHHVLQAFQKAVPSKLEFKSRSTRGRNRQYNASDPVNALLNYGYAFLQSTVRRAINTTGMDASLGYLHEDQPATTPLVYDFQEPYRWLVDYTVLRMVLSRVFSWDDFYFTGDDYRLRIKPPLLDRYADLLREQFNSGVSYGGKRIMWDTVILRKCQELANYLIQKRTTPDLTIPKPFLERSDARELRQKILALSSSDASQLGLGRSTLHYLRKHAREEKPFRIYRQVLSKLSS